MPDGKPPGPSSSDHPKPDAFPDEPSGGWTHPDQSSYPPPGTSLLQLPVNGSKVLTGILSALVVFLGGWVWQTNVALTELRVRAESHVSEGEMKEVLAKLNDINEKVEIVYDRIVVNPPRPGP